MIKIKFTNKENLENDINEISKQIKWITQYRDQYTIIYEVQDKKKFKTLNKNTLGL